SAFTPRVRAPRPYFSLCPLVHYANSTLLFFSPPAPPRVLHSFPTRRSSDLAACRADLSDVRLFDRDGNEAPYVVDTGRAAGASRSEEHTSELQSLTNIVCRLLLEKKKYKPGT